MYLIGLGAVGSFINHYISTKVILNNAQVPSLIFTSLRGAKSPLKLDVDSGKDEIDTLIVATKAHQTFDALRPLVPRLSQSSIIYLFQNGGLAIRDELLGSGLFQCQINMVSISHGIARRDNEIIHTGMGSIFIKEGGVLPMILSKVELLDVKVVPEDALLKQIYLKLIVNSVLNSLTGLFQVKNGVITDIQAMSPIIQDLVMECWPLFQMRLDVSPVEVMDIIITVASKTAQNNNSMQVDIASGKESEIDYILGYLLKAAHRQGISLPKFQLLSDLVNSKAEIIKKFKRPDQ